MARTRQQIEQDMYDEKAQLQQQNAQLAELDSTSATAIWRAWITIVGYAIWLLEKLWDQFKAELDKLLQRNVYGTLPWYVKIAKDFQYNPNQSYFLTLNEFYEAVYATPVPQDRIIAFAAATESVAGNVPVVSVKVAAADSNGRPTPLSTPALNNFKAYLNTKKPAGVRTEPISLPPDEVLPQMEVTYDAIANPAQLRQNIRDAMTAYLYALPFNGELHIERLRDAVQAVEGVVDVYFSSCAVIENSGATQTDLKQARRITLAAGYADWHPDWTNNNQNQLLLIPDA
jgi:hypothetical protein